MKKNLVFLLLTIVLITCFSQIATGQSVSFPTIYLHRGMAGNDVKQLQDLLVNRGYLTLSSDDYANGGYGTFGPKTQMALAQLQQSYGITSTGYYYGPQTIAALQNDTNLANNQYPPPPTTTGNNPPTFDQSTSFNSLPETWYFDPNTGAPLNPPVNVSNMSAYQSGTNIVQPNGGGFINLGENNLTAGTIMGLPTNNVASAAGCSNAGNNQSYNPTLYATLHTTNEPSATIVRDLSSGKCFVGGISRTFGGSHETAAEQQRGLAVYPNSGLTVGNITDSSCAIAFRWDYNRTPLTTLQSSYVVIYNPVNGRRTFAAPVDWGPGILNRAMDVSAGVYTAIGASDGAPLYFDLLPNSKSPSITNFSNCTSI